MTIPRPTRRPGPRRSPAFPRDAIITVAREFAANAEKTNGKSMVILGAGLNHWYHMDMNYRGIINMLVMCGCVGQSGGGWSHYVGQEKLRPQTGWTPLAFALDWNRPPRQMNSTSFFYAHTDQWRYETLGVEARSSRPTAPKGDWDASLIDYNVRAERMGWLPSAPQLKTNPLEVSKAAKAAGMEPKDYVAQALKAGELELSCEIRTIRSQLAAQHVRLALQPARLVGQGPRIFPQAPARHGARRAGQGSGRNGPPEAQGGEVARRGAEG
jgi:nitrate reductase alpha subunit